VTFAQVATALQVATTACAMEQKRNAVVRQIVVPAQVAVVIRPA